MLVAKPTDNQVFQLDGLGRQRFASPQSQLLGRKAIAGFKFEWSGWMQKCCSPPRPIHKGCPVQPGTLVRACLMPRHTWPSTPRR